MIPPRDHLSNFYSPTWIGFMSTVLYYNSTVQQCSWVKCVCHISRQEIKWGLKAVGLVLRSEFFVSAYNYKSLLNNDCIFCSNMRKLHLVRIWIFCQYFQSVFIHFSLIYQNIRFISKIQLSQPNWTSTQVRSDMVIGWTPTQPHPTFKALQDNLRSWI